MSQFDGVEFAQGVLLVLAIVLLIFGSTDIETLTAAPTSDG